MNRFFGSVLRRWQSREVANDAARSPKVLTIADRDHNLDAKPQQTAVPSSMPLSSLVIRDAVVFPLVMAPPCVRDTLWESWLNHVTGLASRRCHRLNSASLLDGFICHVLQREAEVLLADTASDGQSLGAPLPAAVEYLTDYLRPHVEILASSLDDEEVVRQAACDLWSCFPLSRDSTDPDWSATYETMLRRGLRIVHFVIQKRKKGTLCCVPHPCPSVLLASASCVVTLCVAVTDPLKVKIERILACTARAASRTPTDTPDVATLDNGPYFAFVMRFAVACDGASRDRTKDDAETDPQNHDDDTSGALTYGTMSPQAHRGVLALALPSDSAVFVTVDCFAISANETSRVLGIPTSQHPTPDADAVVRALEVRRDSVRLEHRGATAPLQSSRREAPLWLQTIAPRVAFVGRFHVISDVNEVFDPRRLRTCGPHEVALVSIPRAAGASVTVIDVGEPYQTEEGSTHIRTELHVSRCSLLAPFLRRHQVLEVEDMFSQFLRGLSLSTTDAWSGEGLEANRRRLTTTASALLRARQGDASTVHSVTPCPPPSVPVLCGPTMECNTRCRMNEADATSCMTALLLRHIPRPAVDSSDDESDESDDEIDGCDSRDAASHVIEAMLRPLKRGLAVSVRSSAANSIVSTVRPPMPPVVELTAPTVDSPIPGKSPVAADAPQPRIPNHGDGPNGAVSTSEEGAAVEVSVAADGGQLIERFEPAGRQEASHDIIPNDPHRSLPAEAFEPHYSREPSGVAASTAPSDLPDCCDDSSVPRDLRSPASSVRREHELTVSEPRSQPSSPPHNAFIHQGILSWFESSLQVTLSDSHKVIGQPPPPASEAATPATNVNPLRDQLPQPPQQSTTDITAVHEPSLSPIRCSGRDSSSKFYFRRDAPLQPTLSPRIPLIRNTPWPKPPCTSVVHHRPLTEFTYKPPSLFEGAPRPADPLPQPQQQQPQQRMPLCTLEKNVTKSQAAAGKEKHSPNANPWVLRDKGQRAQRIEVNGTRRVPCGSCNCCDVWQQQSRQYLQILNDAVPPSSQQQQQQQQRSMTTDPGSITVPLQHRQPPFTVQYPSQLHSTVPIEVECRQRTKADSRPDSNRKLDAVLGDLLSPSALVVPSPLHTTRRSRGGPPRSRR